MKLMIALVGLALGAVADEWTFENAKLSPNPATGRAADGRLEISLPSKRACAWWEKAFAVTPGKGARFVATAEIALGPGEAAPYNDVMMFVTWYDPAKGNKKGVKFYQRDFMRYTDKGTLRTFDDTFVVPGDCNTVRVEFIAKWHRMDVTIRDVRVETVDAPRPRKVRCVVGNPHEKNANWREDGTDTGKKGWEDPEAVVRSRLKQIENCLTNIFAHVEKPDIILFSEVFADTGTPCPERTAERIPGGPSFALAARYAAKYRCYVAMNVRERTDEGTFHNSTFIVDRAGKHVGTYRKVTLTSGEYMAGILPGDDFGVFDLDFGRVGCLTCWDHWFSETAKYLRRKGAELLLFPLAGCAPDHVDLTFPARGIDIGIPTLVAMRQGHLPNGIVDRDGTWLVKTFEDGGFAWADLDLNERKRTFWLSVGPGAGDPYELYLDESRPELYERQDLRRPRR
ncbi:MAG: carbon-nitrogen hydrolase family protein [Kiritimatiellae bacterium]|nr:carbon-nitrogen hydrolase family protein [Kiritimatiellia bacterium]